MAKSIESNVEDLVNSWLRSYKLNYKLKNNPLNTEIDNALANYFSKNGGMGGNYPDAKLLLRDKVLNDYPVLIEYKGHKNKLEKLDSNGIVDNKTAKNEPNLKNINGYAVNGAVHYANAILEYTNYNEIIAIGVTGHTDKTNKMHCDFGVYLVSRDNLGIGKKIGDFTDLSFLAKDNFDNFIEQVKQNTLTDKELEQYREQREREIEISLKKLNNDIYKEEYGLSEQNRIYLVAASIIATLGVPGKVKPLEKSELKSSKEKGCRDGDIIVRKIDAFLDERKIPKPKKELIINSLGSILLSENLNKVINGESQLKRVFGKIIDDLESDKINWGGV